MRTQKNLICIDILQFFLFLHESLSLSLWICMHDCVCYCCPSSLSLALLCGHLPQLSLWSPLLLPPLSASLCFTHTQSSSNPPLSVYPCKHLTHTHIHSAHTTSRTVPMETHTDRKHAGLCLKARNSMETSCEEAAGYWSISAWRPADWQHKHAHTHTLCARKQIH